MIKKIILGILVFAMVATGTAFLVNKMNNMNMDSVSREMEEPELPLVYCEYGDRVVNRMYGYKQVMATSLMRDGIVPVNADYGVNMLVDDESDYGREYAYELRTIAGDSLIEDGALAGEKSDKGYMRYPIHFRMDMRQNQEYVLVFIITDDAGEKVRYYTRIVNLSEEYADSIIDYVMAFHNTTFEKDYDKEEGNMVSKCLDVTGEATDYDLSHVNLNSSYDMVSWGGLSPMPVTGIIPKITEIDDSYAVIQLSYIIASTSEDITNYYSVDEYYSAQYNRDSGEVKLLAYDRDIESIFDKSFISKERNSISMGISDENSVEFVSSSDNKKLAFVKEGQLWYYDYVTTGLTSVFSFPQGDYTDVRTSNTNLDVNIADMDDDGNIYFVVYGYMNRGSHEGKNGISLYQYTNADSNIEELFFVECDEPFDIMQQEVGRFTFYDKAGEFYFLLDNAIYMIKLDTMEMSTLVEGIPSEKFIVSENRKIVAYPNSDRDENATGITIHNFETREEYVESKTATDRFLALGFVGNDIIYGTARESDIITSADLQPILPLYELYIVKPDGTVVKDYTKPELYIMNTHVEGETIYLERAKKLNSFYEAAEADYISYKYEADTGSMSQTVYYDSRMMNVADITFPSNIYIPGNASQIMTKRRSFDDYEEYSVETSTRENAFYVFNNSGYMGEYNTAGRAIDAVVDESAGLVVDCNGNTIYRTLEATTYNTIADDIYEYQCADVASSLMTCAYMCVEYIDNRVEYNDVMACTSWEDAFEKYTLGVGINISGVSLDTALYFLDRDVPIAVCIEENHYVLVISYNSTHIRYYDPVVNEEVKATREAFAEAMSTQSNTMYTYTSQ